MGKLNSGCLFIIMNYLYFSFFLIYNSSLITYKKKEEVKFWLNHRRVICNYPIIFFFSLGQWLTVKKMQSYISCIFSVLILSSLPYLIFYIFVCVNTNFNILFIFFDKYVLYYFIMLYNIFFFWTSDALPRLRRRKSETFRAQYINSGMVHLI